MNANMKQFNYKINFVELSNKNNYHKMKYKVAEIYTKPGKKIHITRVHENVVET